MTSSTVALAKTPFGAELAMTLSGVHSSQAKMEFSAARETISYRRLIGDAIPGLIVDQAMIQPKLILLTQNLSTVRGSALFTD